jgi:hypothetical protein
MRQVGLVVGLLLCASYQGSAEAKKREPPTRSQALADCESRVPGFGECYKAGPAGRECFQQIQNCKHFLTTAEVAFKTGGWHPNQGPWAKCDEKRAGSPYGRSYTIQCSYLDNIDKDPEFRAILEAARIAEAKRKRRDAEWEVEQRKMAREGAVRVAASLDETLSQAAAFIPGSVADVRTAGVNPCVRVNRLLDEAESTIRQNPSFVGDRKAEYEAEVRTLEARCAAQWRPLRNQFVLSLSHSAPELRRTPYLSTFSDLRQGV